jgi:hypothetical protein
MHKTQCESPTKDCGAAISSLARIARESPGLSVPVTAGSGLSVSVFSNGVGDSDWLPLRYVDSSRRS